METERMNSVDEQKEVLTVAEAAQFLRISKASAYELIRRGEIPHARLGRRILISRAQLLDLLRGEK